MDVAFVVDSSGSIKDTHYKIEKDFINQVASSLNISSGHSRAAIVLFSTNAEVKATFGQYNDIDNFKEVVNKLPHFKKTTRIDRALDVADKEVFSQIRQDVTKLAIVLTDGVQDKDAKKLSEASEPLRKKGVRVLAVGIGGGVSEAELRLMVDSPNDVVHSADFNELKLKVDSIRRRICGKSVKMLVFLSPQRSDSETKLQRSCFLSP